jgi:hypothetical protein
MLILFFFKDSGCTKTPPKIEVTPTVEIKKEVQHNEDSAKKKIDSLVALDKKKTDSIAHQKLVIADYKQDQLVMETTIKEYEDAYDSGKFTNTTPEQYHETVNDYIDVTKKKDTACDKTIKLLETRVTNKDSVIAAKNKLYAQIKQLLNKSLLAKDSLQTYNKELRRSLTNNKIGKKIWTAAAILLAIKVAAGIIK